MPSLSILTSLSWETAPVEDRFLFGFFFLQNSPIGVAQFSPNPLLHDVCPLISPSFFLFRLGVFTFFAHLQSSDTMPLHTVALGAALTPTVIHTLITHVGRAEPDTEGCFADLLPVL